MASILQKLRVKAASIWTARVSDVGGSRKYLWKYITEFKSNPINPPTGNNLARFSVDRHNLKKNANLEFVKVVDKKQFLSTGLQHRSMSKLVGDDAPSVDIAKSQKQLPYNNTGIKWDRISFAVDQHNLKENANLKLVKVLDVKTYLVAGMSYRIILEAKDGEKVNVYEAEVWERPWLNLQELTKFKLLEGGLWKVEDLPANISRARFAVHQYNKKKDFIDTLEFVKVLDVKDCMVEHGTLWYIILFAKVGEKVNVYAAEILNQDCGLKELKEFNLVGEGPFDDSAETLEKLQDMFKITCDSLYKISRKYNVSYLNEWGE